MLKGEQVDINIESLKTLGWTDDSIKDVSEYKYYRQDAIFQDKPTN